MKMIMTLALVLGMSAPLMNSHAEVDVSEKAETVGEKAAVQGRKVKRSVKKGYHRSKEALCMKDDAECAAMKAKHRGKELKEAAEDKGKELKDKID